MDRLDIWRVEHLLDRVFEVCNQLDYRMVNTIDRSSRHNNQLGMLQLERVDTFFPNENPKSMPIKRCNDEEHETHQTGIDKTINLRQTVRTQGYCMNRLTRETLKWSIDWWTEKSRWTYLQQVEQRGERRHLALLIFSVLICRLIDLRCRSYL